MPGMVPAYKRIAVGDIKGGIPVYQTNPVMSPLQHPSLMQLQQQPSYIPMSYTPAYMYPSATDALSQQPLTTSQISPQLAVLPPTRLPVATTQRSCAAAAATEATSATATTPTSAAAAGEGGNRSYLLSTSAAALPTSAHSEIWGSSLKTITASNATMTPGYYHHLLQQQQQQNRLTSVAGLGLYAAPLPTATATASSQVDASASKAAPPALPNNACYVEYFGNNKQLRDTLPTCQDFSAGLCKSPYCKKVHLTEDFVEVSNGSVTVCRDFATRRTCKRSRCKFYHIPVDLPPS
ncbi:muscleblind-like protein 2 [Elysia marginata]|uniref:Muscleblind-like protein 2 n=1 Tax=Elysia marginata TaxID=1093978 RepID=A0AAV4IWN0_9GAST|nr:muscleblind-like protein 2 [Elysia marginata]